jgi:hypothetical protein
MMMRKFALAILSTLLSLLFTSAIIHANPIAPQWNLVDTSGPPRYMHKCAYDIHRNAVVLFGGLDYTDWYPNDTWEYDDRWNVVSTSGPSGRIGHGICYDTAAHLTILFGGRDLFGDYLNDTWSWDGDTWTQIDSSGPPPCAFFGMAYDNLRRRIVLYGGANSSTVFSDTWEWDGNNWTLMPPEGPPGRLFSAMAYRRWPDSSCVIFGGQTGLNGEPLNETWAWDGFAWRQIESQYFTPPVGFGQSMALDEGFSGSLMLFGGRESPAPDTVYGEMWELYDGEWYHGYAEVMPPARAFADMFSFSPTHQILLIGGADDSRIFQDIWAYPIFNSNQYIPGDINDTGVANGVDIIYGVAYFKGGDPPPHICPDCPYFGMEIYCAGDVNGNCAFNGIDLTYMVSYFKGGQDMLRYCPSCPPGR